MKSKLTDEDVEWLEHRLSLAMAPVQPRAEFVHDAKRALLTLSPDEAAGDEGEAGWQSLLSVGLLGLALALFLVVIARYRARARAGARTHCAVPAR